MLFSLKTLFLLFHRIIPLIWLKANSIEPVVVSKEEGKVHFNHNFEETLLLFVNSKNISYLEIVLLHRTQSCYDFPSIFSDSLKRRWWYFELIFFWDAIQNHTPFEATVRMSWREPTIEMYWHLWFLLYETTSIQSCMNAQYLLHLH